MDLARDISRSRRHIAQADAVGRRAAGTPADSQGPDQAGAEGGYSARIDQSRSDGPAQGWPQTRERAVLKLSLFLVSNGFLASEDLHPLDERHQASFVKDENLLERVRHIKHSLALDLVWSHWPPNGLSPVSRASRE